MTRKEAIEAGHKHYDGRPCKYGHGTLKYVSSQGCVTCISDSTKNRSPDVFKKYIKSDKGQEWIKEYRRDPVYRAVQNKHQRSKYAKNPRSYANRQLLATYGISLEKYEVMLESQSGRCSICRQSMEQFKKRFAVDHCHTTGKIRGLLCHSCNTALGLLKENTNTMNSMIKYVEIHNQ